MEYDFEKLAFHLRKYGRVLYEDGDGKVVFQTWEIPERKIINISEPNEDGIQEVTDDQGNTLCCIKSYPSKEAFWVQVQKRINKHDKEAVLAAAIELFGIR